MNIGPPELLLIVVIALVVVGPSRLPDLARSIGKGLQELRKVQDEVRDMVDTGLDDDLKQTANELRQTASDLRRATDVRSAFRNTPHQARARAAALARGDAEDESGDDDLSGDGTVTADVVDEPSAVAEDRPEEATADRPDDPDHAGDGVTPA